MASRRPIRAWLGLIVFWLLAACATPNAPVPLEDIPRSGPTAAVALLSPTVDRPTSTPSPTSSPTPPPTVPATATPAGEYGTVTRVVDGDTIVVTVNGVEERLRYIGIDTPEDDEPCGDVARDANAALVAGRTVRLERDESERDRYGRLLRYVFVGDTFVNAELVAQGYAIARRYAPDTALAVTLESAEQEARAAQRGCHAFGVFPEPTPAVASAPQSAADPSAETTQDACIDFVLPAGATCHPAYPDFCLPGPDEVGDLNCCDIPQYRNFTVLAPDPHNFDGNGDGEGCERGCRQCATDGADGP